MKLKGKAAIVTGASMGIGLAIAEAFAKEGCNLTIVSRNLDDVSKAAAGLRKHGVDVLPLKCDVSRPKEVESMVKKTMRRFGKIDILVNNAGIYGPLGALVANDFAEWKKTIEINLLGTVACTKSVLPHMIKAGKGKIINLSGAGTGSPATPTLSAYVTSKEAVARFTEVVAEEVKYRNVQVNSIAPGAVNTRLLDQVLAAKDRMDKKFVEKSTKQRQTGGTPPEKAAKLALFLASEESDGITGKLVSAVWDDYGGFAARLDEIKDTSIYTLRRIDGVLYKEANR
ncbi:MAG: SDR family oxidoreductase [Candidatus Hadarchaeota archaeon]